MDDSVKNLNADEAEELRKALDAQARRCVELQKQLDRAGTDFEEFVSTAAHNLRESLRDVDVFSQLMAETDAARPGSDAHGFLERIQDGAARMQSLLAGMVDYSATSTGRQSSRTDMEAVLRQVLHATDRQIVERSVVITHDPLPAVMGDFDALSKVLHHLIRNAIQYCEAPCPCVHISSKREDLEWVLSVKDNGPGIEPAFQDRIFGVFKRLHGREHPGHGLGLAFCRKAIEQHGGRIWLESVPGAGSTFYFTVAAADLCSQ